MQKTVLVPITHGTEELEAVTIIDLLRRADISVVIAGEFEVNVCAHGVKIISDKLLSDISEGALFDAVVLPGGGGVVSLVLNEDLKKILENHRERGRLIAAICAAPRILAAHGLLEPGQDITSYPSEEELLRKNYNYLMEAVVKNADIITSRGPATAFAFSLKIIETLMGQSVRESVEDSTLWNKL